MSSASQEQFSGYPPSMDVPLPINRSVSEDGDSGSHDSDALVVGAGVAGLVAACRLAKHGLKVMLLEVNKRVGELKECSL